jgi:hypothetical protein
LKVDPGLLLTERGAVPEAVDTGAQGPIHLFEHVLFVEAVVEAHVADAPAGLQRVPVELPLVAAPTGEPLYVHGVVGKADPSREDLLLAVVGGRPLIRIDLANPARARDVERFRFLRSEVREIVGDGDPVGRVCIEAETAHRGGVAVLAGAGKVGLKRLKVDELRTDDPEVGGPLPGLKLKRVVGPDAERLHGDVVRDPVRKARLHVLKTGVVVPFQILRAEEAARLGAAGAEGPAEVAVQGGGLGVYAGVERRDRR